MVLTGARERLWESLRGDIEIARLWLATPARRSAARWGIWDVAAIYIVSWLALALALAGVRHFGATGGAAALTSVFARDIATVAGIWLLLARIRGGSAAEMGLRRPRDGWAAYLRPLGFYLSVAACGVAGYHLFAAWSGVDLAPRAGWISARIGEEWALASLNVADLTLWGPFTEELFYRGVLIAALMRLMPLGWAVIVGAACFGLVHGLNPGYGIMGVGIGMVIGALLCGLYARAGSIWPGVLAHGGLNALILSFNI